MDGSSHPSAQALYLSDPADGWTAGWTPQFAPRQETGPAPSAPADEEIRFRSFRLLPRARLLLRDGVPLELGSRAFDLLHALASACGTVVAKDDIFRRVWPTTVVDESNLRFQVAALRKALGKDRDLVKTIAGRGYLFAADPAPAAHGGEWPRPAEHHAAVGDLPRLLDASEASEALRGLLRSALDEFWEMISRDSRFGPASGGVRR